jgi:hypothetical protein
MPVFPPFFGVTRFWFLGASRRWECKSTKTNFQKIASKSQKVFTKKSTKNPKPNFLDLVFGWGLGAGG